MARLGVAGRHLNRYVGAARLLKREWPGRILDIDRLIGLTHSGLLGTAFIPFDFAFSLLLAAGSTDLHDHDPGGSS
ncbi:hypothetical protein OG194_32510 [Streptomyces sp. NBC_01288]|uniref:hypothetical protein n=1 Tax=Streptomyces sp. NBC_01288 TaxID=2903814 RepID=UPI002E13C1B1|nr:hypothetical protein OG194_32510 [Streptomyces sp. NBC_01288]